MTETLLTERSTDPTDGTPLLRMMEELQRQVPLKRDVKADTRLINLDPETADTLLVDMPGGLEEFGITDHAHAQIQTHLGIGQKLYDRLRSGEPGDGKRKKPIKAQPDLLAHLANGLLSRQPSTRMVRVLDGKARAFLSDVFRPRDNWDLLQQAILPALAEVGRPGLIFKEASLTESHMYLKIVMPDFEMPVTPAVGDIVRGGLIVQNSEIGSSSLLIAPYTDVLWCTNGCTHTDFGQKQRHVGGRSNQADTAWEYYSDETLALEDAAFFSKCRDTVKGVLNEQVFVAIVQQMRDLADIDLGDEPVKAVEEITKRNDFSQTESDAILNALVAEQGRLGMSAWAMVNAITQTARDLESPDRRADLETLAGRMVSDPKLVTV